MSEWTIDLNCNNRADDGDTDLIYESEDEDDVWDVWDMLIEELDAEWVLGGHKPIKPRGFEWGKKSWNGDNTLMHKIGWSKIFEQ